MGADPGPGSEPLDVARPTAGMTSALFLQQREARWSGCQSRTQFTLLHYHRNMNQKRLSCGLSASLGQRLDGQAEAPSLAYLEVCGVGGALLRVARWYG